MCHSHFMWSARIRLFSAGLIVLVYCCVVVCEATAQTPFLEARYEFDTEVEPVADSTGQNGNFVLLGNGFDPLLGEPSLIGGEGFSIGLEAPGVNHPTGSFLLVRDLPHPDSFSYSVWIKPQFTGSDQAIFDRDNVWWPSPCAYYCLYIDPFGALVWKTGGVESILTDEEVIEEESIHHVVVTHADTDGADTGQADRSLIYVNGELVGESDDPEEIPSLDSIADANEIYRDLYVGTLSSFAGYSGQMDDFQFYSTELTAEQVAEMHANPGTLAKFAGADGDYNGDGAVDVLDIDLQAVAMNSQDLDLDTFDENKDGTVDYEDRLIWVKTHAGTWVGDANFDREFNSTDLVDVFMATKYDTKETASWSQGDWNGDAVFDSGDLVVAFEDRGYDMGKPPAASPVPEPTTSMLLLAGLIGIAVCRKGTARLVSC